MTKLYRHAPIIEAVVELRTATAVAPTKLRKARDRLSKSYSRSEDLIEITATGMAGGPAPKIHQSIVGHALSSDDGVDVVHVKGTGLTMSRRAPYLGWDSFFERITAGMKDWSAAVGSCPLSRIGVRYINRLDIPWRDGSPVVEEDDYLRSGIAKLPFDHGNFVSFAMRAEASLPGGEYSFILQTAVATPVLIAHGALALDIDVYRQVDGAMSDDDILRHLGEMRRWKNELFEASITDQARELING